jgi:hypothetical protein
MAKYWEPSEGTPLSKSVTTPLGPNGAPRAVAKASGWPSVVHIHRVPEGDLIGIRADANLGPNGIGSTVGTLFDVSREVGSLQQSLLVHHAFLGFWAPVPTTASDRR